MRSPLLILLVSTTALLLGPFHVQAQTGLTPHGPIFITSENFTSVDGVTGGTGTFSDPYIISGWEIHTNSSFGIHVRNTRSFFIIRNVLVEGTRPTGLSEGVLLDNVQNGLVDNADITGFTYGVEVSLGSSNAVENSNIWNNTDGIYLQGSNHLVKNNHLHNNTEYGVSATSSTFNTFRNNNSSENGIVTNGAGFFITGSNNIFDNNTVNGNSWFGIKMVGSPFSASSNNIFSKNTIRQNGGGICGCDGGGLVLVDNATSNVIVGNYVADQDNGIGLEVNLVGTFHNNLTLNRVVRNRFGLYVINGSQNIIYNNYFNNTTNVFDSTHQNSWNITKTLRANILGGPFQAGNFYSDYGGTNTDGDGIGDTPYATTDNINLDFQPLTLSQPTVVHDIAALSIKANPVSARTGSIIMLTSTVLNQGTVPETFNVTVSSSICFPDPCLETSIETRIFTNIPAFTRTNFTTSWSTVGLVPGTYTLQVRASTVPGETYTTNNVSPPSNVTLTRNLPPVANFTIDNTTPFAGDQVTMNASASYDPDGMIIGYSWNFGDNVMGTGQTISHAWIQAGRYTVTLTVTDNEGNSSSIAKVVDVASNHPSQPLNFALSADSGKAILTWTTPSRTGGSPITMYLIYRASTASGPWTNIANTTTNSYQDTTVANGQTYYYQVSAANQAGMTSPPSTSLNVLVPDQTSPLEAIPPMWLEIIIAASLIAIASGLLVFRRARRPGRA